MKKFILPLAISAVAAIASPAHAARLSVTSECATKRNEVTVARRSVEVAESAVRISKTSLQRLLIAQTRANGRSYVADKAATTSAAILVRSQGYEATAQAKVDAAQVTLDAVLSQSNVRATAAAQKALAKAQAALTAAAKITAGAQARSTADAAKAATATSEAAAAAASVASATSDWQAAIAAVAAPKADLATAAAAAKAACPQVAAR